MVNMPFFILSNIASAIFCLDLSYYETPNNIFMDFLLDTETVSQTVADAENNCSCL